MEFRKRTIQTEAKLCFQRRVTNKDCEIYLPPLKKANKSNVPVADFELIMFFIPG